jgi:CheY-like chemotaxis protein
LAQSMLTVVESMQVLIVEDHRESREQLERYLTRRGHDVAVAGDLRTGIDLLDEQRFDAIISDFALPDGTGYALMSEVRRRGINALGIAISGYPYPSDVNEPGVTGFDYHLTKPVDCDRLCSLLKEIRVSEGDASTESKNLPIRS